MESQPVEERLPQNLDAAINHLGAHLEAATKDTGHGYIIEYSPQNPEAPDTYQVNVRILRNNTSS